jgi:hypothetical protein
MPYLAPDFDPDVFMSYTHGHVPGLADPPLKRWSQAMIDKLKEDLVNLFTEFDELKIWDDRSLDPTAHLTDELRTTIERSCLLLIVMSPRYLASAWCKDELAWFERQFVERRKGVGRVFIVRAVSTDESKWPRCLKDERGNADLGFRFHPMTDKEGVPPYGWPDLFDRNEEFRSALSTLRTTLVGRLQEIREQLREIKKSDERHAAPVSLTAAAPSMRPPRVYLHARPEFDALRRNVSDELYAAGCRVVAPIPATGGSPVDWTTESRARIEAAQHCDALTLLRGATNHNFEDEFLDIAMDERERISAARDAPLPCAVLDASRAPFVMANLARRNSIALVDVNQPGWSTFFRDWVETSRAVAA